MSKTVSKFALVAGVVLAMAFIFSCSSDDGGGGGGDTQGGVSSSSDDGGGNLQSYSYCLLSDERICLDGPFTLEDCNTAGGYPSNSCPYGGVEPSSSSGEAPSSSGVAPSSNSEGVSSSVETDDNPSSSGIAPSSGSVEPSSSSGVSSSVGTGDNPSSSSVTPSSSSSEAVTPSSSSEAGQELSSSSAVPGGGSSSSIVNTSSWYVSTDVSDYNGTSTVGNVEYADGKYIALVQENGVAVAKIQNYTLGKMLENGPPYNPNPFVEMVLEIKNKGEYESLLSCDGFSYKYKGAPHIFKAIISLVADESYHNISVGSASDWTTVEIPFSDLRQTAWSSHLVRFELAYLEGYLESLKWLVFGTLSPNTGSLEVKDVQCLSPATMTVISSMTDSRDGKEYKTNPHLEIDQCVWFAENLDYEAPGSIMCDGRPFCDGGGRLYDWETAMTACPSGWHLPTREEFGRCISVDVNSGRWWSSSEYDSNNAYFAPVASSGNKNNLLPVRCVKD